MERNRSEEMTLALSQAVRKRSEIENIFTRSWRLKLKIDNFLIRHF